MVRQGANGNLHLGGDATLGVDPDPKRREKSHPYDPRHGVDALVRVPTRQDGAQECSRIPTVVDLGKKAPPDPAT
jgi:hypothetical protein